MQLIFVYNAENDVFNAVFDYVHKVFKPSTYPCHLCNLTYHNLGQRKAWKDFQSETKVDFSFWYIRQFEEEFKQTFDYPVVLQRKQGGLDLVMDKRQLEQFDNVEELIEGLKKEISARRT